MEEFNQLKSTVLVAGNCDNYGVSRSVVQKIASEGRQVSRKNDDALTSLMQMSKDFDSQTKDRTIYGFIQIVMAKPLCIMYWREVGTRINHELSKQGRLS